MPVQQGAGDRADQQSREDAGERDEPGEGGGAVSVEGEQDERHADHGLRHAGDLHAEQHASQGRDAQQSTVGAIGGAHGSQILRRRRHRPSERSGRHWREGSVRMMLFRARPAEVTRR